MEQKKKKIYEIRISLKHSKPRIYRKIQINSNTELKDLYMYILTLFGWSGGHLHQYETNDGLFYSDKKDFEGYFDCDDIRDYKNVKISKFLKNVKDDLLLIYDFGDDWLHEIRLDKIFDYVSEDEFKQVCIDGKMASPPEDCGGLYGYYDLLETLSDENNEEHKDMMEWMEECGYENFNENEFYIESINDTLNMNKFVILKKERAKKK